MNEMEQHSANRNFDASHFKNYQIINGGMEGVYLYLRYTYTILKILIAGLIYYRFQRFGKRKHM